MTPLVRLGLLVNLTRPRAREGLEVLLRAARETGVALLAPPELADLGGGVLEPCAAPAFAEAGAQGVISLGGDGSLLGAVRALQGASLPLIGFNVGRLGYLTAVNEEGFARALRALAEGRYAEELRTALASETILASGTPAAALPDALNDVVVSRAESGRAFALRVSVDGFPVARWLCDGLILATPTGSTAYSLSVGGPVVMPSAKTITLSVIAPHALSARPLVIPDASRVDVCLEDDERPAAIYADGQRVGLLASGDHVCVGLSPRAIRLLVPEGHNPYAPLSRKLGWGAGFTR